MAHGSYQHSYSGGGGCSGGGGADTSLSLSPSVTQQLSMQRDLSRSLQSFQGTIAEAHPSHRMALSAGRSAATAGLDETTEVRRAPPPRAWLHRHRDGGSTDSRPRARPQRGAEACMRQARHTVLLLGRGTLSREFALQELRWARQHEVRLIGLHDPGVDVREELEALPADLKPSVASLDYRPCTLLEEQATDQGEGGGEGATEAEDAGRALQVDVASPAGSAPASVSAQPEFHPGGGVDAKTLAWVLGAAGGYRDR